MAYDSLEEKKRRQQRSQEQIQYSPVSGAVASVPTSPSEATYTQVDVTEKGGQSRTDNSSFGQTQQSSNTSNVTRTRFVGEDPTFTKTPTINAENDTLLRSLGRQRQERLSKLQSSLQDSADRERRKLKYSAWSDFLTSLGNIAGLGNATPVQPDNTRTLESFKRMQDIYDAADNIENDPTLTWLDKERLNRQAVIAESNLRAEAADAALQNQWALNKASQVGFERESTSNTTGSTTSSQRGSSYSSDYGKSVSQRGLTETGEQIENLKLSKDKPFTYWGQSSGRPAGNLIKADEAKTRAIVRDVLGSEENDYKSTILPGVDIKAINEAIDKAGIRGLMIKINENPESYDNSLADVASIIEKADTSGIYANWLSGGSYEDGDFGTEIEL